MFIEKTAKSGGGSNNLGHTPAPKATHKKMAGKMTKKTAIKHQHGGDNMPKVIGFKKRY